MSRNALLSLILPLFLLASRDAWPCSAYAPVGTPTLAANYDWRVSGGMILVNAKGWKKTAFLDHATPGQVPAAWTADYASVTTTQWGREFPVQGINTEGLAGVLLNGPATWSPDQSVRGISEQQWLQYQLDSYTTVSEIETHLADLSINPISGKIHYFFCDKTSECAWVEFETGRARLRRSSADPVARAVTNSSFNASRTHWNQFVSAGGNARTLPGSYNSLDRFVRASWFSRQGLNTELFDGLASLAGIGMTQWSSVFNLETPKISIRAAGSSRVEDVLLNDPSLKISCRDAPIPAMKILEGTEFSSWTTYDEARSLTLLRRAAKPASGFSEEIMKAMITYPHSFECQE